MPSLPTTPDPERPFSLLDPELPLALLPVRIETRYYLEQEPPELRVRIFPDTVHSDGHATALSESEQDLGRAFWRRTWRAGADAAGRDAAFAWLAGRVGPWRAAWVANQLEPTNGELAPTAPVPEGRPLVPAPRFPAVSTLAEGSPTWARLLPARFSVTLLGPILSQLAVFGTWWGEPIPDELALAPGPVDVGGDPDARAWLEAQGLAWTFDFAAAEEVGLGVRIDLSGFPEQRLADGFPYLVVCGVRAVDQREPLEALLEAHRYTHGLDFIPQGTPTNTTETSGPGLSLETPDLALLRAAELERGDPADRPDLEVDGALYREAAADAASIALGLGRDNALDRSTNAALAELPWAEAMNRALWPALGGHYLDDVLDGLVTSEGRDWLRDWSVSFARGGATLPTLLVGAQPYGLLPVSLVERPGGGPTTEIEHVEDILAQLWMPWLVDAEAVPRLDPDAPDVSEDGSESEGDQAARVSKIVGAVPHATSLRLQRVEAERSFYTSEWDRRLEELGIGCGTKPTGEEYDEFLDSPHWNAFTRLAIALDEATRNNAQKVALEQAADDIEALLGRSEAEAAYDATLATYTRDWLVDFVAEHIVRTDPILELVELPGASGMMGEPGEPNAFFNVHPPNTAVDWALPLVAPSGSVNDVDDLRAWLEELADSLDDHWGESNDYTTPFPLLRTLLRYGIQQATGSGDQGVLRAGLAGAHTLEGDIDDPVPGQTPVPRRLVGRSQPGLVDIATIAADPVGELERLLRETLGVFGYRLDAWYTAVAAWRLENKRQGRARGIQVGAYGLLTNVKPRESTSPSQGYALAPSLTHATTAAVLRSGWAALGGTGESAGLAVNLSSDRVRRARWIIDGVRQGQDLARLLGARFERGLHDATPGLDKWIDDFRVRALAAVGSTVPPNAIVDGLLLARAWSDDDDLTGEEVAAAAGIAEVLALAGDDSQRIEEVLDSLAADLDAVADAALAQSVFSLAQGNVPEATAALTAAATGEVTLSELTFADTPRPALTVTHRLLLLLDRAAKGWPGAAGSGRALAAPALDAWVAALLGDPDDYRFSACFDDPETGKTLAGPFDATLSVLGLAALDLVYLAPLGEQTDLGRLGALLTAWADGRRTAGVPPTVVATITTDAGDPSLDDLAVVCRSLRRLIAEARDLDGRDVAGPGATEVAPGLDTTELGARVKRARAVLEAGRKRVVDALPAAEGRPARGDVRAAMLSLAGFVLSAGTPKAIEQAALIAQAQALVSEIDERLAALDALSAADNETETPDGELSRTAALRSQLSLLVGEAFPLAPFCAPANGAELDASFARPRLASREAATGWLAAAGRVDPGARRLRVAVDLAEAAREEIRLDFSLGQLPDYEEEGWAAVERPARDERGRLCLLATGHQPRFADGAVAGLVLGTWTEAVPRNRQTAGLAVHFDAPSARAPQAILLCSAEPGRGFDFEFVRDVVTQTFELARIRMVGPETLSRMGQYLPATYLHGDTNPGGPTPETP